MVMPLSESVSSRAFRVDGSIGSLKVTSMLETGVLRGFGATAASDTIAGGARSTVTA